MVEIPGTGLSYTEQQRTSASGGLVSVVVLAIIVFAIAYFLAS